MKIKTKLNDTPIHHRGRSIIWNYFIIIFLSQNIILSWLSFQYFKCRPYQCPSSKSSQVFPHWFSCYFISNNKSCEKKGNLCCYSFQMELQEFLFRGIGVIYLRNIVHETQVQLAVQGIGLEMSSEVFPTPSIFLEAAPQWGCRYFLEMHNTPGHEILSFLCAKHKKQQQTLTLKRNKNIFLSERIKGLWFFIEQLCAFAAWEICKIK